MKFRKSPLLFMFILLSGCGKMLSEEGFEKWIEENRQIVTVQHTCNGIRFQMEYHPKPVVIQSDFQKQSRQENFTVTISSKPDSMISSKFYPFAKKYMPLQFRLKQGHQRLRCIKVDPDTTFAHKGCYSASIRFDGKVEYSEQPIAVEYNDVFFGCNSEIEFNFAELNIAELPVISNRPMP